ncbi:ATP-dependent Clp protease proteolytic subunit [Streptomyces sp. H27-D2]|uniref:ATP-dependent Clp protease proteolytic subunit n=1 Tax=Streptomyces sp. H27-D2 TaxID=3046304 RepID=UPI003FA71A03
MLPTARVLIHQPSVSEPFHGQASDLEIQAREMQRVRALLEELLVRHTGRPAARISQDIEREKIFDAEAAVAYGLVDGPTSSRKQAPVRP